MYAGNGGRHRRAPCCKLDGWGGLDEIDREEGFALERDGEVRKGDGLRLGRADQSLIVTSLVMFRGDRRDERGKGVFAQNLPLFFFFFFLSLFHLYFAEAQCHTTGLHTDGAERSTRVGRLPHHPYGRTHPETDWRDLAQLTVPDNRNRPRGNWNICLSLSLSVSLLRLSLSLCPYIVLFLLLYFVALLCLHLSLFPSSSPLADALFPSLPPRPLSHSPDMDNSHDFPGHPNSCIPSVVPPGVDPSLVDFREFYPYIPNEIKHRKRTTQAQLEILEETFAHDKKPNGVMRANLARQLDMTPRGVQVSTQIYTPPDLPF